MSDLENNRKYLEQRILTAQALYNKGLYEDCINYIELTAGFAWLNFSGFYKLQSLEKILINIGKSLPAFKIETKLNSQETKTNKNILHICSSLRLAGGHSKLLFNWIKTDYKNSHTILSTRLSLDDMKNVSSAYIKDNVPSLINLNADSKLKKAEELKKHLEGFHYDYIILHTDPNEVIATVALSDIKIKTPVLLLNHADHTFWLGSTITDILLQIRESNIALDKKRRNISDQALLPIPIKSNQFIKKYNSENQTKQLKILSTGSLFKYTPTKEYNFYEEIFTLAKKHPEILINIVGIDKDSKYALKYQLKNINYLGLLNSEDLNQLENEADIFLEGFPLPSFTALLQVSLKKIPFVLHYKPLSSMMLFEENKKNGISYPNNREEWRTEVKKLIENQEHRIQIAKKQYGYIDNLYSENAWLDLLAKAYEKADSKVHSLNSFTTDNFYDTEQEYTLSQVDNTKISHFKYTSGLGFIWKIKLLFSIFSKNKNVKYYLSGKHIFEYLFNPRYNFK